MPPNAVRREIGGAWHSGLLMLTHTADGEQECQRRGPPFAFR
ncbi:hypothetical protein FHS41_005542 [Streptomyces violarus]|uniref:Uncharacterized protein n=1 Tax=Streptomyces violarus TaxID=67380 RepID=A0A7W4ZV41_9ACTN|nr:hypothetical protein [Streptomyces violarus]